jgi:hypothetical protein
MNPLDSGARLWPQLAPMTTRKNGADRKTAVIRIRVTEKHKRAFAAEARRSGLTTSSWMLSMCIKAIQGAGRTAAR